MKLYVYGKIKGEFTDKETGKIIKYYKICAIKPVYYCESRNGFEMSGSDCVRLSCTEKAYNNVTVDNTNCRGAWYNADFDEHGKLVYLESVDKPIK